MYGRCRKDTLAKCDQCLAHCIRRRLVAACQLHYADNTTTTATLGKLFLWHTLWHKSEVSRHFWCLNVLNASLCFIMLHYHHYYCYTWQAISLTHFVAQSWSLKTLLMWRVVVLLDNGAPVNPVVRLDCIRLAHYHIKCTISECTMWIHVCMWVHLFILQWTAHWLH